MGWLKVRGIWIAAALVLLQFGVLDVTPASANPDFNCISTEAGTGVVEFAFEQETIDVCDILFDDGTISAIVAGEEGEAPCGEDSAECIGVFNDGNNGEVRIYFDEDITGATINGTPASNRGGTANVFPCASGAVCTVIINYSALGTA